MDAVVDEPTAIDQSAQLDLATLSLDTALLSRVGKDIVPLAWPPRAPQEDRGIMLARYPGLERRTTGQYEIEFGLFTALGVARRVTEQQITWVVDRDYVVEHPRIEQPTTACQESFLNVTQVLSMSSQSAPISSRPTEGFGHTRSATSS
jgi:hypothetical protein